MNTNNAKFTQSVGQFRPRLSLYHPNAKGTGCAIKLDLHPAHDDVDGCIMLCAANQMTVGNRNCPNPVFPRFDWENQICVKLDFNDLCQFLQVFRGASESIADGRGLYHRTSKASTRIVLRHVAEVAFGYSLELYRTLSGGGETKARIFLDAAEAGGLCESIAGAMYLVSFGIPMLTAGEVRPSETERLEADNANAA